jgi:hypothetical protein
MAEFEFPTMTYYKVSESDYEALAEVTHGLLLKRCVCPLCKNRSIIEKPATTEELIHSTERVIEELERRGWVREKWANEEGNVCLIRAGTNAQLNLFENPWYREFAQFLNILSLAQSPHDSLISWNDAEGRTAEEILGKLRDFLYELKGR